MILSVRYRRKWLIGPLRAEIYDGVRWVRLSAICTERQRLIDENFRRNELILREIRA